MSHLKCSRVSTRCQGRFIINGNSRRFTIYLSNISSNALKLSKEEKMSMRASSKQGRPAGRSITKSSGKDSNKGEKQPPSVIEIVPGKFNETDWLSLLENDDTEDFIADIFESIWTETTKQIQQIYIRKQLLPFTLMMTENALSNVIQVKNKTKY